jgi:hypothetical protein
MLDIHFSDQAIERLRQRIEQPAQPPRRSLRPFVRGILAAAAMTLIAVSLVWWLPNGKDDQPKFEPTFAMTIHARKDAAAPGPEKIQAALKKNAEAVAVIPLMARGADVREDLIKARRDGKLPLPPAVSLDMELVNTSKQSVEIRPGEATLELDLPAERIVRIEAPANAEEPAFLRPEKLQLDVGAKHVFRVDRLIAGSRGKLEYLYLTEPGEVPLTARLRIAISGKAIVVTAPPVRIGVVVQSP